MKCVACGMLGTFDHQQQCGRNLAVVKVKKSKRRRSEAVAAGSRRKGGKAATGLTWEDLHAAPKPTNPAGAYYAAPSFPSPVVAVVAVVGERRSDVGGGAGAGVGASPELGRDVERGGGSGAQAQAGGGSGRGAAPTGGWDIRSSSAEETGMGAFGWVSDGDSDNGGGGGESDEDESDGSSDRSASGQPNVGGGGSSTGCGAGFREEDDDECKLGEADACGVAGEVEGSYGSEESDSEVEPDSDEDAVLAVIECHPTLRVRLYAEMVGLDGGEYLPRRLHSEAPAPGGAGHGAVMPFLHADPVVFGDPAKLGVDVLKACHSLAARGIYGEGMLGICNLHCAGMLYESAA